MSAKTDRLHFERKLWSEGYERIMGLDEVGRGCLAGPVVAAGVVIRPNSGLCSVDEIRDSKELKEETRLRLSDEIKSGAEFWTVQVCTKEEIDELNILWASIRAMEKCTEQKNAKPDYLLVDGNRYSPTLIPHSCLIKGDDRSISIAAASILAKVFRDTLMQELHEKFPEFGWDSNVGYPTAHHRRALKDYGYTPHHRGSFKLGTDKVYR